MRRLKRALVIAACSAGGLFLVVAGIGVQFLLRSPTAHWPGPRISDALPLEELAGFDRIPLVVYLLAWAAVALSLGLLVRRLRVERLTAGVVLFLAVGVELLLIDTFSLYLVRQIPGGQALHEAFRLQALYLPPVLAGAAGAVFGRAHRPSDGGPLLLAALVGTAGMIGMFSALTPAHRIRLDILERFVPAVFPPVANAIVAASSLVLLLVARGLARRRRRAWQLAVALLAASSVFHLLKGLDYEEAVLVGVLALALVARRQDFDRAGDPDGRMRSLRLAGAFLGAIYAYGALAFGVRHVLNDERPFSAALVLRRTTHALVHVRLPGGEHIGQWFPLSVFLLAVAGVIAVVESWLAPWRFRLRQEAEQRARARTLVRRWGTDALAPFTLRTDTSYFFSAGQRAFLAYRVVGGVAFVSGDPIGPPDEISPVFREFLDFAHARGWNVAGLGASARNVALYRSLGLRTLYWGDEAVIDPATFSLEGRKIRKVRQSVHRLERAGYTAEFRWAGEVRRELREDLRAIETAWLGDRARRGHTMTIDHLFRLGGKDALFVLGLDESGTVRGFLHFATCRASAALSLSSMPRTAGTPNGFNEWLVTSAVHWARENGITLVSLNFSPFARVLAAREELGGLHRIRRDALIAIKSRLELQLDNLYRFNDGFQPEWSPRYVVYERRANLPRVGVAALAAEGYFRRGSG